MGKKESIDDFLRKIPLRNKDVAVIGPSCEVADDPSLLYFANRMANQKGSLTVIDAEPHFAYLSEGDIYAHMDDFKSMICKGVRAKHPYVVIGDVTETKLEDKFDIIFEKETFKHMVSIKAARSKSNRIIYPARKVLGAYHQMLKKGGKAIFAYEYLSRDDGYSALIGLLDADPRFECQSEPGFFTDIYLLRNLNKQKVRSLGQEGISTSIRLDSQGYVRLGSGYSNMLILQAGKVR